MTPEDQIRELQEVNAEQARIIAQLAKANVELVGASTDAVRKYLAATEGLERERKRVIQMPLTKPQAVPAERAPRVRRDPEEEFKKR